MSQNNGFGLIHARIEPELKPFPYHKRCGSPLKKLIFGFECQTCNALVSEKAVVWKRNSWIEQES